MADQLRLKGGVWLGALVSGALAVGTITGAPTANASCASFFGIGNSAQCTSNLTSVAIAIGTNAQAHADGLFGGAFAIGTAYAQTYKAFDFATAVGNGSNAQADGFFGIAGQVGKGGAYTKGLGANIALNVTPGNTGDVEAFAVGCGNIAVNLFGNANSVQASYVSAAYLFNIAVNVLGRETSVGAVPPTPGPLATGNLAFNVFGSNNDVVAGPGPFAVAGSIFKTGATVYKQKPGFNINGIKVPNTAAAGGGAKTSAPTVAATSHRANAAAANVGHKK